MNIEIFNHTYKARRFGRQQNVRGYIGTTHKDFEVSLNVHPSTDKSQTQPEGERKSKHLLASGTDILVPADQDTGTKGDLLFYHGKWYECISANEWDHTMLNHWEYEFALVPEDAAGTTDTGEPGETVGGDDDEGEWS